MFTNYIKWWDAHWYIAMAALIAALGYAIYTRLRRR